MAEHEEAAISLKSRRGRRWKRPSSTPPSVEAAVEGGGIIATVHVSTWPVLEAEIKKPISIRCVPIISTPNTMKYVQWFVMEKTIRQRIYFQDMENSTIDANTDYTDRISKDKMYTLTIDPVMLKDERTFLCQVGAGPVGSDEAETQLKVYAAPDLPVIEKNPGTKSILETEPVEIASCVTKNGYPMPNVTWYKDRTQLQTDPQMQKRTRVTLQATEEANGLYTMRSVLHYLLEIHDEYSTFYCEVSYRMPMGIDKMKESEAINISISYPPESVEFLIDPNVLQEMDNVTMECRSDGTSSVEYTFLKLLDGKMEDIYSIGNTVVLTELSRNDTGVYGCKILDLDTFMEFFSNKTITVNFLDPIMFTPKGPYIFTEGEKNMRISCEAEASQNSTVVWINHKTVVSTGELLKLPMVAFDDAGNYTCIVAMPGVPNLSRQKTINIVVKESMEFLIHPNVLKEMDNVTMECRSDGTSSVEYTFLKLLDGKMEDINSIGNTAVLTELSRNDNGVYGCKILDLDMFKEFFSNKTITVNFLDPIMFTPKGPYIFTEGEKNMRISCEAEASQNSTVVWIKHKKTVVSTGELLKLPMVAFDDAGNYTCIVAVPGVPNLSWQKTINIVVKGPPHGNCNITKFQNNGAYVNITCVFMGDPMPKVTCNADKEPTLRYHRQKHYVVSELILPLPMRGMELTCNGSNMHGNTVKFSVVQGDVAQGKSSGGVVIVVIIVCILLLAILGAVLYFLYKKGKIPCGRSGKQSITQAEFHDNIVVEAKNDQKVPEETVLLQGVNGDKKPPNHQ
ncbi:cell surface glycoprotein MUC18-like isoform X2 [Rhinoraja longicauda]